MLFQECNYPEFVDCDDPFPENPEPEWPDCVYGPTGEFCNYTELMPSPICCDFFHQCSNNIEYEMPCQMGPDGERLWFHPEFKVL